MRKIFACLLLVPALSIFAILPGCGNQKKDPEPKSAEKKEEVKKTVGEVKTIAPGQGVIKGKVVYDGEVPVAAPIAAMNEHPDKKCCLEAKDSEKVDQTWLVGKDKGVANVVVWLVEADKNQKFEVKQTEGFAEIDQPNCVYVPHVIALKPGQKLKIKNSAPIAHNSKWEADPAKNENGGKTLESGKDMEVALKPQNSPISLRCDVHKWMEAKIWVLPNQYLAVTNDKGEFEISGVPADVEVSVVAWHEGAGFFHGGKTGTKTTFKKGENSIDLKVKK